MKTKHLKRQEAQARQLVYDAEMSDRYSRCLDHKNLSKVLSELRVFLYSISLSQVRRLQTVFLTNNDLLGEFRVAVAQVFSDILE